MDKDALLADLSTNPSFFGPPSAYAETCRGLINHICPNAHSLSLLPDFKHTQQSKYRKLNEDHRRKERNTTPPPPYSKNTETPRTASTLPDDDDKANTPKSLAIPSKDYDGSSESEYAVIRRPAPKLSKAQRERIRQRTRELRGNGVARGKKTGIRLKVRRVEPETEEMKEERERQRLKDEQVRRHLARTLFPSDEDDDAVMKEERDVDRE